MGGAKVRGIFYVHLCKILIIVSMYTFIACLLSLENVCSCETIQSCRDAGFQGLELLTRCR